MFCNLLKMRKVLYILAFVVLAVGCGPKLKITLTECESQQAPSALDTDEPRFGWQLDGGQDCLQTAYEIEVYDEWSGLRTPLWSSGRIESDQSILVKYGGPQLTPRRVYKWRVRVWDNHGRRSAWSRRATFRLAPEDEWMDAEWIGAVTQADAHFPAGRNYHGGELKTPEVVEAWSHVDKSGWRSICLRNEFVTEKKITDAMVYVCGLGHYELHINGTKVGDSQFAPLWSDYDKTVYYNAYDVTGLVRRGRNAVGVLLGNGFYNIAGGGRYRKLQIGFGPETLFLKLAIRYSDGTEQIIASDGTWRIAESPITFNTIYGGEDYDARLEQKGWDRYDFDDSSWRIPAIQEPPRGKLRAQQAPPVKIMKRYGVQSVHKLTPEEVAQATQSTKREVSPTALLLDMGQNLAGFPEIRVRGDRGDIITMVPAERITDSNAADQRQTGRQHYYTYVLKGEDTETWHPRFSYYGFRYILLEGAVLDGMKNPDGLPVVESIESCFVHNAAADTGEFECSNEIFNAAHCLIQNAVRSNMQSVLTDCPHREKLGWLEQVHLNGPGLLYNYDMRTYIPKVMRDMADAQYDNGMIPTTAPQYVIFEGPGMEAFADSPEWSGAFVVMPFMYSEFYGDDSLIREYYDRMCAYVDYLGSRAEEGLLDFGLGDWYDYGDFRAGFSRNTPVGLVATAHYCMYLDYIVRAADLVGDTAARERYSAMRSEVCDAFNRKYFDPATARYGSGSQCSYALPLFVGMVPEGEYERVLENLKKEIYAHGTRLTTGDVGNRYLFRVLADNGLNNVMYAMHDHEDVPGYGFQLKYGATTLTEQWDPRQGSSWNHFMMGQIDEWFFRSLGGISTDDGYGHIVIRPAVVGDLTFVKASCTTPYGRVASHWRRENGRFTIDVAVPANCTAEVWLPGDDEPQRVGSGQYTFGKQITENKNNR